MMEVDDNPTLLLNKIPRCEVCEKSFSNKKRCAVFSCGHRFCEDCSPQKSEKCRKCDTGEFILFLDEVPEMSTVHQRLKENVLTYVDTKDATLARVIIKDLEHLQQQIDNEIRRRLEPEAAVPALEEPIVQEPERPKPHPPQFAAKSPPQQEPGPPPQFPAKPQSQPGPPQFPAPQQEPGPPQFPAKPQPQPGPPQFPAPQQAAPQPSMEPPPVRKEPSIPATTQTVQKQSPTVDNTKSPKQQQPKRRNDQKSCCSLL